MSEYRAVLSKQSNLVKGKEKALGQERKILGHRKELVQHHLADVGNLQEQHARQLDPASTAAVDYRSELEKQSMSLWSKQYDLSEERKMIDSRKQSAQRQLDELNKFRLDLQTKRQ